MPQTSAKNNALNGTSLPKMSNRDNLKYSSEVCGGEDKGPRQLWFDFEGGPLPPYFKLGGVLFRSQKLAVTNKMYTQVYMLLDFMRNLKLDNSIPIEQDIKRIYNECKIYIKPVFDLLRLVKPHCEVVLNVAHYLSNITENYYSKSSLEFLIDGLLELYYKERRELGRK